MGTPPRELGNMLSVSMGLSALKEIEAELNVLFKEFEQDDTPKFDNYPISEAFAQDHEDLFIENDVLLVIQRWGERARMKRERGREGEGGGGEKDEEREEEGERGARAQESSRYNKETTATVTRTTTRKPLRTIQCPF